MQSNTSALVITTCVTPLIIQAYCKATRSIQPQRRGRPVVAPNSLPNFRNSSPVSSIKFCWKRSTSNPGTIGFCYTNYLFYFLRCYSQTCTNTCRNSIGRGYKRKCTKINIQHTSLCTFCQYFFALRLFYC